MENMGLTECLNTYRNKRVLITGHTGFKGAWLSIWLKTLGAEVIGYALDPSHESGIFSNSGISKKITDYRGDIRDIGNLKNAFIEEKPEIVFHLAAQPLVIEGYNKPVETFEINVQGTVNVLEAVRATPSVRTVIVVTSDKCYENCEWDWGYRESDPMGGYDPYSASKGAAELIIQAYRRSYFLPAHIGIASVRAGNVIGGGDWADNRLVPDIFKGLEKNKVIKLRNPDSIRPWQHVLEPLSGYLMLGIKLLENPNLFSGGWNFGPFLHDVYTVRQLTERIIAEYGQGSYETIENKSATHEAKFLKLDISKAFSVLGWCPVMSVQETISQTTNWYKNYSDGCTMNLVIKQIVEYQKKWISRNEN
jgi:CDP-glucose 4,6-dehydratase